MVTTGLEMGIAIPLPPVELPSTITTIHPPPAPPPQQQPRPQRVSSYCPRLHCKGFIITDEYDVAYCLLCSRPLREQVKWWKGRNPGRPSLPGSRKRRKGRRNGTRNGSGR